VIRKILFNRRLIKYATAPKPAANRVPSTVYRVPYMEFIGLFFEFIFLLGGVYLYLFAIGRIKLKDHANKAKAEAFRDNNSSWLRFAALALTAIMLVNILVHVRQLMAV